MLKNKMNRRITGLFLALIVCLSGSFSVSSSELIPEKDIREDSASYRTKKAAYGDLKETTMMGSNEYYPVFRKVIYRGPDAVYTGLASESRAMEVKAGDTIMKVKPIVDEVAVTEKELQLKRLQETYEKEKAEKEKAINDQIKERDKQSDANTIEKMNIRIRISQIELEQYQYSREKEIKDLQEALQEMYQNREETYITAPIDGNVSGMLYVNEGDIIKSGTVICTVTDPSVRMLRTTNTALPFGLKVTAEFSSAQSVYEVPGEVVASTALIPTLAPGPFAQIEITESDDTKGKSFRSPRIEALKLELKNVLLIPNSAKELDQGNTFVTVLGPDNQPHKRFIQIGVSGNSDTWVLNGLSEGEEVIIH